MRPTFALPLLAALALTGHASLADELHEHGGDPQQLGSVQFVNSCSPAVQELFGQAVAMLHSFWYEEARRRFGTVTERDPDCAIAWWGVAMTYWQPLWEPRGPSAEALHKGHDAIAKAAALEGGTPRERDFVAALASFYRDSDKTDHLDRVLAYEKAMQQLQHRHASDTEARVFYALALLGSATSLPPDKTYALQKNAGELLQPVLRAQPNHPGVAHYMIHAFDYPGLAAGALEAARRYAQIAPDSPHAQHMPSHIFTRLGLWQESIESNRRVIDVARRHNVVGEELHAMDYLVFAHLQRGEDRLAREVIESMPKIPSGATLYFAGVYAHAAIPARYAVERRQWAQAAALSVPAEFPGGRYAWADATLYFARALGAARMGKLEQARSDVARLAELHQTLQEYREDYWATQVEIQRQSAAAWLAFAEGKHEEAVALMQSAATLEDSTDKHPVTPGQIIPARDLLGQMLLELKRPRKAGVEFAKVLELEPNRLSALQGAARAATLAGELDRAREVCARLAELTANSDRAGVRCAPERVSTDR